MVPIYVIGLGFYMVPILLARGRVSGTAYEPFTGRLLYHLLGTRPDAASLQLAPGLPAANRGTLNLLVRPMAWVSRVTGFVPKAFLYPPLRPTSEGAMVGARCEFLDKALRDHVAAGDQVVILGAGWDTRAYGLLAGRDAALFEVDALATARSQGSQFRLDERSHEREASPSPNSPSLLRLREAQGPAERDHAGGWQVLPQHCGDG